MIQTPMIVKSVDRDGNCCFYSVVGQLAGCSYSFPGEPSNQQELRKQCVQWLRDNIDEPIGGGDEDNRLTIRQALEVTISDLADDQIQTTDDYFKRMSTFQYGSSMELIAVAQLFKVSVICVENNDNTTAENHNSKRPIFNNIKNPQEVVNPAVYEYQGSDHTGQHLYLYHTDRTHHDTHGRLEHFDELVSSRTAEDRTGTVLPIGTSGADDDDNEQGESLPGIDTTSTTNIPTITATTTGNIVTDGLDTARNADDEDELQGKDNNDNVAKSSSVEPSKESWNPVVVYTTNTADEHLASQVDTTTGGVGTAGTTGGVGTAGISTPKNADDDDAKSFWGHMNTMLPETTKNPVVENSTNNKNNVQSVSRSHPSPFTAASRSAESPACTIPEVVVPGKSDLLLSPLSNVFSPTKNKATNRFANVPGAVENDRSLASDDVSFTESEAKQINWGNTEVSSFGSKTASVTSTEAKLLNPSHDSRSNGSSIITTTTSCNGKLGARARVQVGILKTKDYRRQDYDSVLTGDTATQQSYGTNPINDMLYTLPRSIPNVEMANPQHGPSLLEIAKWGDDDEDSDIVSNPKSSVEEESARRPRMTGDVAVSIFIV